MSDLPPELFCIKKGYVSNPGPVYFLDDPKTSVDGAAVTFQPDVYRFAEWLCAITELDRVVDIGCGWAEKLSAIHDVHPDWEFTGLDYGANITYCIDHYDWGKWLDADLENVGRIDAEAAVVVCSDVIEHLVDPRVLIGSIRQSGAEFVLISTPERDVQYGYDHMGPSNNLCHVREWNAQELKCFLEQEGLNVEHVGLTRGNDQTWAMGTILAACH